MINLLGNSIKFTQDGIIKVIINDFDERTLKITIIDSGSGIKKEKLNIASYFMKNTM